MKYARAGVGGVYPMVGENRGQWNGGKEKSDNWSPEKYCDSIYGMLVWKKDLATHVSRGKGTVLNSNTGEEACGEESTSNTWVVLSPVFLAAPEEYIYIFFRFQYTLHIEETLLQDVQA